MISVTEILTLSNKGLLGVKTLTDEQKEAILESNYTLEDLTENGKAYAAYMKVKDALKKEAPKEEAPQHQYPPEAIEMAKGWYDSDDVVAAMVESYPTEYDSVKENRGKIKIAMYGFLGLYVPNSAQFFNQLCGEKGTGKSTVEDALVDLTFPFNHNRCLKGIIKPQSWARASERVDPKRPVHLATDDLDLNDDAAQNNIKTMISKGRNKEVMVTGSNGRQEFIPVCERAMITNTKVDPQGDEQILERSLIYTFEGNYYDENGEWRYSGDVPTIEEADLHKEACDYFWSNLPYPQKLPNNHRDAMIRKPITHRRFEIILTIARGIALSRHSETLEECHIREAVKMYIDEFMTIQEVGNGFVAPEIDRKLNANEEKVYNYFRKKGIGLVSWTELSEATGLYRSYLRRILYGREKAVGDKVTYSGGIIDLISDVAVRNTDYKSKDEFPFVCVEGTVKGAVKRIVNKSKYDLVYFIGDEIETCTDLTALDSNQSDLTAGSKSLTALDSNTMGLDSNTDLSEFQGGIDSDCWFKSSEEILEENPHLQEVEKARAYGVEPASDWEPGKVTPLDPSKVAHSFAELAKLRPDLANKEAL